MILRILIEFPKIRVTPIPEFQKGGRHEADSGSDAVMISATYLPDECFKVCQDQFIDEYLLNLKVVVTRRRWMRSTIASNELVYANALKQERQKAAVARGAMPATRSPKAPELDPGMATADAPQKTSQPHAVVHVDPTARLAPLLALGLVVLAIIIGPLYRRRSARKRT